MITVKKRIIKEVMIFLFFILLTGIMTYPLIFNLQNAENLGDPLFISWNLAWDVHKFFTDPLHLFEANIFFPNHNTLAYSEHLVGLAIFVIPVLLLIDKPIVSYNVLALFSFVLSGYGTYLFSFYLTKNKLAAVVAGIIFAFFPYKIFQFGHLHVISTQWIPFAFLFLYRFFEYRDYKNMGLFLLFSLLQVLSSGSLAIFFTICIAVLGLFLFITGKGYKDRRLMVKIAIAVIISFCVLLPFYIPYLENQKVMGFVRDTSEVEYYSARIENYLASTSRLYYQSTTGFGKQESYLFPGILPVVLALIGLLAPGKINDRETLKRISITIIDIGIVICFLLIIITIIFGGIDMNLFGLRIRSHNLLNPWLIFTMLLLIRKPLNKSQIPFLLSSIFPANKTQVSFLMLALLAVSVSLGMGTLHSDKFYNFFYDYVPGFKFIRVTARMGMFAGFFLSLLAAYGVQRLMELKVIRRVVFIIIPVILIEYASFPIELQSIEDTPEVYQWLEKEKGDFSIFELPMDNFMLNIRYVYYSTKHWKKMVNGYSGFFPPSDHFADRFSTHDLPALLDYLEYIGVKYVIVHREHMNASQLKEIKELKEQLIFKASFVTDDVYELKDRKLVRKDSIDLKTLKVITSERWTASSNHNASDVKLAFDENLETRWHSGRAQYPGIYFTLDLKDTYKIAAISIEFGRYYEDYPLGMIIKTSTDGTHWEDIPFQNNVLSDFLYSSIKTPKNIKYIMVFQPIQSRYIQMILSKSDDTYYWSIPEIRVFSN